MRRNVLVGGSAGYGLNTLTYLFVNILRKNHAHIHVYKDYMSRVRGGHNFTQIRYGDEPVTGHDPQLDIIVALDENTAKFHLQRLQADGVILCDPSYAPEDPRVMAIPFKEIMAANQNPKGISMVGLGALTKLLGFEESILDSAVVAKWSDAGKKKNIQTAKDAWHKAHSRYTPIESTSGGPLYMNGNQAIAMGAMAGGLDFYTAYPMAPSTSIMSTLSQFEVAGKILVEQAEDEIAAINAAIGASASGARSMTGSSGGGYALMTEAIGFAGIGEVPIVIADVQRPGPATGLPTRTEQSDLSFILSAPQGEMPRMVTSVRNVSDAFYTSQRAMNIAEAYRLPVMILNDEYLADASQTLEEIDLTGLQIVNHVDQLPPHGGRYKNYDLSGILTPRIVPATSGEALVMTDSHEHDDYGHISEDPGVRTAMMKRRMEKLNLLKQEMIEPHFYGDQGAKTILLSWGSMDGIVKEAVDVLVDEGIPVGALSFGDLFPLPDKTLLDLQEKGVRFVNVEMNYTGQLARLIRMETGIAMADSILKYDGRQMNWRELVTAVKELM